MQGGKPRLAVMNSIDATAPAIQLVEKPFYAPQRRRPVTAKSKELTAKLKECDPDVNGYVLALENENAKLHRAIASLEARNVSANNRIDALAGEIDEHRCHLKMNDEELIEHIARTTHAAIKAEGGWRAFCERHKLPAIE
jgi:hypothetical protein